MFYRRLAELTYSWGYKWAEVRIFALSFRFMISCSCNLYISHTSLPYFTFYVEAYFYGVDVGVEWKVFSGILS